MRGSKSKDKKALHLVAALLHGEGIIIGQKEVDSKSNEITTFQPLLQDIDIKGKTVTADAMHAQVDNAKYIKERGGDYLFVVKKNQPTIFEAIRDLDEDFFPPEEVDYDKGHGRIEIRKIRSSTALNDYLEFPYLGQVFRIERDYKDP